VRTSFQILGTTMLALALAMTPALATLTAFAGDKDAKKEVDHRKELEQGIATTNKQMVVKALDALAADGGADLAKLILNIALQVDKLEKFSVADRNDIFDACEAALSKVKDEKGEAFIVDTLKKNKDRDPRVRVILVDVLGKKTTPASEDALIDALQDKNSTVQKTAIQYLGIRKSVKAIEPMTELLAKVEKKRDEPWLDALRFFTTLTGKDLTTADEWKNWWLASKATFDPKKVRPAQVRGAGVGETALRGAPTLFGTEILSKKCVFILDVSGSMNRKDPLWETGKPRPISTDPGDPAYGDVPVERMRMFRLKEAMKKAILELPADTEFTIVTFASFARTWNNELVKATQTNKDDAIAFAESMNPEGYTVTDEALRMAFGLPGDPNTFYLFSDGDPQRGKNADGTPQKIDIQTILEEIEQLNRTRKVKIFTIGIGEANADAMRRIAALTGGSFTAVQ